MTWNRRDSWLAGVLGLGLVAAGSLAQVGPTIDERLPKKVPGSDMTMLGEMMPSACCLPSGACLELTASECGDYDGEFLEGQSCVIPDLGEPGTYVLRNHPDNDLVPPQYGLRLDELFDLNPGQLDVFSFDFEAPGALMSDRRHMPGRPDRRELPQHRRRVSG